MQKFIVTTDPIAFGKAVNTALMTEKLRICPGTSYAVTIYKSLPVFCSVALENHGGQILITATEGASFINEVTRYLSYGYWVVPGTIYITNTEVNMSTNPDDRVAIRLYTVFVGN
jgi:hypothetical protein